MTCGDVVCRPGTHIALDQGDTFGPFVAGPDGVVLFEVMMGDPRSFPADEDGLRAVPRRRKVRATAEPADRRCPTGSRTRGTERSQRRRSRRARCRSAAIRTTSSTRPRSIDELRAQAALAARARLRRRDDERAPRRVRGLPAEPAAARGLPARRDAATAGRRRARCCCRCGRRRSSPRRSRGSRRAFPAGSGSASRPARCPIDFEIMDVPMDDLTGAVHGRARAAGAAMLDGREPARWPTIPRSRACREHPIPLLSAAEASPRCAAPPGSGAGLLFDSLVDARARAASSSTRTARPGGTGAVRARPAGVARRAAASARRPPDRRVPQLRAATRPAHWGGDEMVDAPDAPSSVVSGLVDALRPRRAPTR